MDEVLFIIIYAIVTTEESFLEKTNTTVIVSVIHMLTVSAGTGSTDTVCADCTGDTYSNGSFSSCLPHTK